jgi:carbonic anhydrase
VSAEHPLLRNNKDWARRVERDTPGFFGQLVAQQRPRYLWIGCSDSRVPANQIVGLPPGEVFVHRNVANLIVHSDLNAVSVLDFAVNALGVKEIIVCGHYGCGGVEAALSPETGRAYDHWIRHIRDIAKFYREEIEAQPTQVARVRRLCELNVVVQCVHVRESPVQRTSAGEKVRVHGWIYDLADGLLRDLGDLIDSTRPMAPCGMD